MTITSDVIIVGGGLHGLSCALYLARSHLSVTVLEKDTAGQHASSVNAGGLRTLLRDIPEIPLSLESQKRWEHLDDILGMELAEPAKVTQNVGQIGVAIEESELEWCKARAEQTNRLGFNYEEIIDRKELYNLIDNLGSECLGGIIVRRDGHASPANATQGFRTAAIASGARLFEGITINQVIHERQKWTVNTNGGVFEAPLVVNCAGAWGHKVAEKFGDWLPIECQALSMMVTKRVSFEIKPVVIGIDQPLSFKQTNIGTLVIGGGIPAKPQPELGTSMPFAERLVESAKTLTRFFPCFSDIQIVRTWSGLEGFTPDKIPIIGPSTEIENLWHVCGFSAHGFQLAPETGFRVARSIINNQVDNLIAPFAPSRFKDLRRV